MPDIMPHYYDNSRDFMLINNILPSITALIPSLIIKVTMSLVQALKTSSKRLYGDNARMMASDIYR
jgi:hypothetical protein